MKRHLTLSLLALSTLLLGATLRLSADPAKPSKPKAAAKAPSQPAKDRIPTDIAGNEAVLETIRGFKGRGEVGDPASRPLSPQAALESFEIADGFQLDLIANEPAVRQPLAIHFDERGRMWVTQYLQYPYPAGLKVVRYDNWLRAVFDKMPPAPPNHDRGADKITIHEDTNGDGKFDSHKTFLDGLNIATSCAVGRGGVWVLNPPYLMFYPDRNRDDVPDSDPEVHLTGFGLNDTHAVANSLHWGPDGWLYGGQGSTCWATVSSEVTKDVHFKGQAIWRYHPESKVFEVFAEGGGNTFNVETDSAGRIYSGTNWGSYRGVHFVQGGRYVKNWGKHGPLMNPYSFGFFHHMDHTGYKPRFSHALLINESTGLPPAYHGQMVSIIPLHNRVHASKMLRDGSTFDTEDTTLLMTTKDHWFRPVGLAMGPDGGVYLADWYDTRLTHVDPRDTWDRAHGRVYRLRGDNFKPYQPRDLGKLTSDQLVDQLDSENKWLRNTVVRLLGDRKDASIAPRLRKLLSEETGQLALEALWALNLSAGLTDADVRLAVAHANPRVRQWAIRLVGDRRQISPSLAKTFAERSKLETDVEVRTQLASTAARLPADAALPMIFALLEHDADAADPFAPMLLWWATESKAAARPAELVAQLTTPAAKKHPLIRETILPRLARRFAADLSPAHQTALASLLKSAESDKEREDLIRGVAAAFEGRRIGKLQPELASLLSSGELNPRTSDAALVDVALRSGDKAAHARVLELISDDDPKHKLARIHYIELLGQVGQTEAGPALLAAARTSRWHSVRRAALAAIGRFGDDSFGREIVAMYGDLPTDQEVRPTAIDILSTRPVWSASLLAAVSTGKIRREDVPLDVVERLKLHDDPKLNKLVRGLWGSTRATPEQLRSEIAHVADLLGSGEGDLSRGRELYTKTCAKCHKLFGDGKKVGPELTGYERTNLDFLLLAVLDPSAAIREEYTTFRLITVDGQVLTGFIRDRGQQTITIENADKGQQVIPLADIEEGPIAIKTSLMPDRLLGQYNDQQIRDLFQYLRAAAPLKK